MYFIKCVDILGEGTQLHFVRQAILLAATFDVILKEDIYNAAAGDCLIESVLYNLRNRYNDFQMDMPFTVDQYRMLWANSARQLTRKDPAFVSMTDLQFNQGWFQMSQPGQWALQTFGDFFIAAIAACVQKNILVFEITSNRVFSVSATRLGTNRTTDIPIILGYNGNHYESLLPVDDNAVAASTRLSNAYLAGLDQHQLRTVNQ